MKLEISENVINFLPIKRTDQIAWQMHCSFAFWLIENLKPKVFVELGVFKGDSFCAFNQAIKSLNVSCKSFGIDTWQGDEHTGPYTEQVYAELTDHNDFLYSSFSKLCRVSFSEALSYFEDESIDLLHIDGFHSYEAAKNDYESWLPKMSKSSIILFHDISVKERGFGVGKLWNELKQKYQTFEFVQSNGLGVLAIGKNHLPENVKKLFDLSEPEQSFIRSLFQALGVRTLLLTKLEYFQKELSKNNVRIETAEPKMHKKKKKGLIKKLLRNSK